MAKKRNKDEYLAKAEADIDNGWKALPIFEAQRSAALLRLVTATDDRIRMTVLKNMPVEAQFSMGTRWSIDALTTAMPWIFSTCPNNNEPLPELISEPEYKEGSNLAEYAEGYDAAVIAFTNLHQGRFQAFVANHEPRITFAHASEEVALAELEKRAYEVYENRTELPDSLQSDEKLKPLLLLREIVPTKAEKGTGDRVKLKFDDELKAAVRNVAAVELEVHRTEIPETTAFSGVAYASIRKVQAALAALGTAHEFLHLSSILRDINGGAVSSLTFRADTNELNALIAAVAELSVQETTQILPLLTFDGAMPALGSLGQLLISPNGHEVVMPRAYSKGGRWERNLLKWMARNPATKRQYDSFSAQKEGIALPSLLSLLQKAKVIARDSVPISDAGRAITDVDILAFDPRDGCLLVMQHKWLIEPDTVNESKACDAELEKGIEQARTSKTYLNNQDYARQLLQGIPAAGYARLEGIVICKGMEPTGFVRETDVPVVTERWFTETFTESRGLGNLYDLAKTRPDRKQLAADWRNEFNSWYIAGYELRLPVMAQIIKSE